MPDDAGGDADANDVVAVARVGGDADGDEDKADNGSLDDEAGGGANDDVHMDGHEARVPSTSLLRTLT